MRIKVFLGVLVLTALFSRSTITANAEVNSNETFGIYSNSFETPHIKWAKPYYRGPLKVLSILPTFRHRESVELWQRLDCEIIPLMTNSMEIFAEKVSGNVSPSTVDETTVTEAAKKAMAAEWDVAVVGKCRWDSLPDFIREGILHKVQSEGRGLVIVLFTENDVVKYPGEIQDILKLPQTLDGIKIAQALPWTDMEVLSRLAPKDAVKTYIMGKGRVVVIDYHQKDFRTDKAEKFGSIRPVLVPHEKDYWCPDETLMYQNHSPLYDYYMGLVARAVIWASGREPEIRIENISVPETAIPRENISARKIDVDINSQKEIPPGLKIRWAVRDVLNRVEAEGKSDIDRKPGGASASIQVPAFKEGKHFIDVWIRDGDKIIDWASRSLIVESPSFVKEVKMDNFSFERGQQVTGTVFTEGNIPRGTGLIIEVWDAFDGLVLRFPLKSDGQKHMFRFLIPDPRSILHTVVAKLEDAKGVVSEARADFTLPDRGFDELNFNLWGGVSLEPTRKYQHQQLLRLGADSAHGVNTPQTAHAASELGLRIMPYTFTMISWYPVIEGKHMREHCLVSDEKAYWCSGAVEKNSELAVSLDPYAPLAFWLCEEAGLGHMYDNLCYCDKCVEAFRTYLKQTYGTIEALNESWGSNLKDFSEAGPVTMQEALDMKQLPRWADFRVSMEKRSTRIFTDVVHAMLKANPRTIPGGMSTCEIHSDVGYDYWLFFKDLKEFAAQPFGTAEHIEARYADSFMTPPRRLDLCFGLSDDEARMRLIPWYSLALNGNGLFFFHIGNLQGQGGAATMTPTLEAPVRTVGTVLAQVREIKTGIDKLLFTSRKHDDHVRILYSQMSLHASTVGAPKGNWWPGLYIMGDCYQALEDAGIHHGTIPSQELVEGKLKYPKTRALMLADAQSLSAAEAGAIRKYCESGGLVITTSMPGTMNEHLKILPQSPLADMFPSTNDLTVTSVGKGRAIYIGDLIRGYGKRMRVAGKGVDASQKLAQILEEYAGIKPEVRVTTTEGQFQTEVRPVLFQKDGNSYVVLARERFNVPPVNVSVKFPESGYIYDVRHKKLLSKGDTATMTMEAASVDIIAQLPYKVEKLRMTVKRMPPRQFEYNITVDTNGKHAGHHVIYLVLKDEQGKLLPWYPRRILAGNGTCRGIFTVDLNEPAGIYTLEAEDVATGVKAQALLRVEKTGSGQNLAEVPVRAPAGFKPGTSATAEPYSESGWANEIVHEKTGMEMVFVPAGEFFMGSLPSETGRAADEGPVHKVKIPKSFYIGKYEVTQEEWMKVMKNNPSFFNLDKNNPVDTVSWNDCSEFLKKAADGLRFPTEAEWEYVCRAGTRTGFFFGDDAADLKTYAQYAGSDNTATMPAGWNRPNAWSIYDMSGSVWEWCQDTYHGNYAGAPSDGKAWSAGGTQEYVLRGGSFHSASDDCRSAARYRYNPSEKSIEFGLRVARDIE